MTAVRPPAGGDAVERAYDRCEEYAHLIWKYYPQKPPVPEPKL